MTLRTCDAKRAPDIWTPSISVLDYDVAITESLGSLRTLIAHSKELLQVPGNGSFSQTSALTFSSLYRHVVRS